MTSPFIAASTLALVLAGITGAAGEELVSIAPPIDSFRDYFGQDVDVDLESGTVVVGAWGYGSGQSGAAWVIEWEGGERVFTVLQPHPVPQPARAGSGVAIEGDLIAVGAPYDGRVASQAGAVYLFRKQDSEWRLEEILAPPELQANDWFGFHLDIDGGQIAIGAATDGSSGRPGKVYLYHRENGEWVYQEIAPVDGAAEDFFGTDVFIDGDLLAVGATGVDGEFVEEGAVYLYRRHGLVWRIEEKVLPLEPSDYLYFGVKIHGDGSRIAVTAPADFDDSTEPGRVHLLTPGEPDWEQTIAFPGDGAYANLGTSVVIDGATIYVGALGAYNYERQLGQVLVLAEGNEGWEMVDVLIGETRATTTSYAFGWASAGDSSTLVIGAPGYRTRGELSGDTFVRGVPRCLGRDATILGTPEDDVLIATDGVDVILSGSGDDVIAGFGAEDVVCSGSGHDVLDGDPRAVTDATAGDFRVANGVWFADSYPIE